MIYNLSSYREQKNKKSHAQEQALIEHRFAKLISMADRQEDIERRRAQAKWLPYLLNPDFN